MRRTAILSDIHGNAFALKEVLAELDADGIEHGVCLGDVLQGGPEPAACVDLLADRGWPVVLGNADAFVLDPASAEGSTETISERQLRVREWSHEQLGAARRNVVAAYPPTVTLDLGDGPALLACHATPSSYHPVVFPTASEEEFRAAFGGAREDIVACGHIHLPYLRRIGDTLVLNPGSVGLGYDHGVDPDALRFDPWASWAVVGVDGGRLSIDLRRTPFDPAAVAEAYRASGMPHGEKYARAWLAEP
jgi:predicted phosphodiesterase